MKKALLIILFVLFLSACVKQINLSSFELKEGFLGYTIKNIQPIDEDLGGYVKEISYEKGNSRIDVHIIENSKFMDGSDLLENIIPALKKAQGAIEEASFILDGKEIKILTDDNEDRTPVNYMASCGNYAFIVSVNRNEDLEDGKKFMQAILKMC